MAQGAPGTGCYPLDDRYESLVRKSIPHTVSLVVGSRVLQVQDVELTFDEGWSPYAQLTVTVVRPTSDNTLADLDPRVGATCTLTVGYDDKTTASPATLTWSGILRTRGIIRPDNTMRLTFASAEMLLQDRLITSSTARNYAATIQADAVINDVLFWMIPGAVVNAGPGGFPAGTIGAALTVGPGDNPWNVITDLADRVNGRVYALDAATFMMDRPANAAGTVRHALRVGDTGTVVSSDAEISLDDWASGVIVESRWNDAAGAAQLARGWATVPANVPKVIKVERTRPSTNAKNQNSAISVLYRANSRGRNITMDAHAAYWVRPGQTVLVTLPQGDPETAIVKAVTFRPVEGVMSLTTRSLDPLGTITVGG